MAWVWSDISAHCRLFMEDLAESECLSGGWDIELGQRKG